MFSCVSLITFIRIFILSLSLTFGIYFVVKGSSIWFEYGKFRYIVGYNTILAAGILKNFKSLT